MREALKQPKKSRPRPLMPAQAEAFAQGETPAPMLVAEGIFAVPVAFPDPYLRFTYCYAIEDTEAGLHLVDPGWGSEAAWVELTEGLKQVGRDIGSVRTVLATHCHPDHSGMAPLIRSRTGAQVMMSGVDEDDARAAPGVPLDPATLEAWRVPRDRWEEVLPRQAAGGWRLADDFAVDRRLGDGDTVAVPGRNFEVILTPGHTRGHLCLVDRAADVILTGDHILPGMNPGIGIGAWGAGNPLEEMIEAIDKVAELGDIDVLPGHEYAFPGLRHRALEIRSHHERRNAEVAAALSADPQASVWDAAASLRWSMGWSNLAGPHLMLALKQVQMHLAFLAGRPDGIPPSPLWPD